MTIFFRSLILAGLIASALAIPAKAGTYQTTSGATQPLLDIFGDPHPYPGDIVPGADLTGADLTDADLRYADLTNAVLSNASLSGAFLSFANLSFADLNGTNLTGANLTGANLGGANLSQAYLSFGSLIGAILSGAIGNSLVDTFNAHATQLANKYTLSEIADLRPGSSMIEVVDGQATMNFRVKESDNMVDSFDTAETSDVTLPAPDPGKKFFRCAGPE